MRYLGHGRRVTLSIVPRGRGELALPDSTRRSSREAAGPGGGRPIAASRARARPALHVSSHRQVVTLPNGLRVWTVKHPSVPVVTLMLLVRRGAADDPPGKEGLAALTVDMLDEGSGGRSAIQMHEALARIGAQLDSDIGSDAALMSVTVLSRFTAPALTLLADMVARPSLTEDDFVRVRQLRLHRLTQLRDMPGAVADRAFVRLLFGAHPYGHTPLGNEQSLASLTIDDVREFHAARHAAGGRDAGGGRRLRTRRDLPAWPQCLRRVGRRAAGAARRPPPPCRSRRGSTSCRALARRNRSCASDTSRLRGTRPTITRWWRPTWCSADSSSAAST